MLHRSTSLGPLQCEIVQKGESPPTFAVVLCHGFGAPATDLVPLAFELVERNPDWPDSIRFVFPGAPLSLAEFGYGDARAWWHIDFEPLMRIQQGDRATAERLKEETPEGLAPARKQLMACVEALRQQTQLPMGRILLGGFSQGAMITTDLTLRLEEAPAGLAILSGTLLSEGEWKRRAPTRRGLPVFMSHGRQDPTLPFFGAEALRDLLVEAGLEVDFLPFSGGHTIPSDALDRLSALVKARLQPPMVRSGTP